MGAAGEGPPSSSLAAPASVLAAPGSILGVPGCSLAHSASLPEIPTVSSASPTLLPASPALKPTSPAPKPRTAASVPAGEGSAAPDDETAERRQDTAGRRDSWRAGLVERADRGQRAGSAGFGAGLAGNGPGDTARHDQKETLQQLILYSPVRGQSPGRSRRGLRDSPCGIQASPIRPPRRDVGLRIADRDTLLSGVN